MFSGLRRRNAKNSALLAVLVLAFVTLWPKNTYAGNPHTATFRLGSAAQPFGWSTAIADFDADQKPDFAIANKIGTSTHGYEYSLEFELSLESRQVFHFHSSYSGLTVTAIDLDNDKDLDVVLTRVSNGEVVGVWINNGHGQFSEGLTDSVFPGRILLPAAGLYSTSNSPTVAATVLRKPLPGALSAGFGLGLQQIPCDAVIHPDAHCGSAIPLSLSPRAPPVSPSF